MEKQIYTLSNQLAIITANSTYLGSMLHRESDCAIDIIIHLAQHVSRTHTVWNLATGC